MNSAKCQPERARPDGPTLRCTTRAGTEEAADDSEKALGRMEESESEEPTESESDEDLEGGDVAVGAR